MRDKKSASSGSKPAAKRGKAKPRAAADKPARKKGLSFGFLIFVFIFLAGTGMFMLVQRQFAVTCDLKVRRLQQKIDSEKSKQESLRLGIARFKSPGRIARIASDDLGLGYPTVVIYLKYKRGPDGNIVCASTFEQRVRPAVVSDKKKEEKPDTGSPQASILEGPGGTASNR